MLELIICGSVTSTCLVGLVVGLLVYWTVQKWKYNFPPGPRGLPILGNALQIDQAILHKQAFEWSKKYGPVITVKTGPTSIIVVNTIDTALEVLVKKSTDFVGRMMIPSLDVFTYGGKNIVFGNYGPTWKLHRMIVSKTLRNYLQGDALQNRVQDAIKTAFEEIDKLDGEFDPAEYINFLVGNILMGLCFGGKYTYNDKEVQYIIEKEEIFFKSVGIGTWEDFIPGLQYVYKTKDFKFVEEFVKEVFDGYFTRKLREAEETFDKVKGI